MSDDEIGSISNSCLVSVITLICVPNAKEDTKLSSIIQVRKMVLRSGSAAQYMRHSAADDDNDFEAEEADRMMRAADAEAASSKNSKNNNSRTNHQRAGSLVNSNRLGVKSNHF